MDLFINTLLPIGFVVALSAGLIAFALCPPKLPRRRTYFPEIPDLGPGFEGVSWLECWREVEQYELEKCGQLFAPTRPIHRMETVRY